MNSMENMEKKSSAIWWIVGIIVVVGLGYWVMSGRSEQGTNTNSATPPTSTTGEAPSPAPTLNGTVTIGAVLALTGDGAAYGLPEQKAAQLAVEEINAKGGVGGKKLEIAYEDGKCDGKAGATAGEKLISFQEVKAIIGGSCSGETLGFAPIANERKVVVISPSASSPEITTKGGDFVFRFYPSDALAGKVAAMYALKEVGAKRAAVISENTDYAQGLRKVFTKTFDENGGGVAVDETYNTGTTDFRTQALKVKNANVQVIYVIPQTPAPGVALIKALKDLKIEAKILTGEVMIGDEVVKNNADVLAGVTGFDPAFDTTSASAAAFINAYKSRYNEELAYPFMQAAAYSEVYALKDLIEKEGNDGVKLQQALAKLSNWSGGAMSGVTLDKNGDIEWKSYNVKEIKDGKAGVLKVMDME